MTPASDANFKHNYQTHLKHLKLKGLQPKTIEAYSRDHGLTKLEKLAVTLIDFVI
jgi:hypothetical protein